MEVPQLLFIDVGVVQLLNKVVHAPLFATTGARAFCPFIPASWPMRLWPRSLSTSVACSWLVLLVVHFALCSF